MSGALVAPPAEFVRPSHSARAVVRRRRPGRPRLLRRRMAASRVRRRAPQFRAGRRSDARFRHAVVQGPISQKLAHRPGQTGPLRLLLSEVRSQVRRFGNALSLACDAMKVHRRVFRFRSGAISCRVTEQIVCFDPEVPTSVRVSGSFDVANSVVNDPGQAKTSRTTSPSLTVGRSGRP